MKYRFLQKRCKGKNYFLFSKYFPYFIYSYPDNIYINNYYTMKYFFRK
jgi:hypothetical protein